MAIRLAKSKADEGKTVKIYSVGKKGRDAMRKTGYQMALEYRDAMNNFDFTLANEVGMRLIGDFVAGDLDEVHVVYGQFISLARQVPTTLTVLPMAATAGEGEAKAGSNDYIFEPDKEGLLAELLPRFIKVQVYRGMLDTSASEHAARMTAMDNATSACDDMIDSLTLLYNKTRQTVITKELMDIVGGAEALKG